MGLDSFAIFKDIPATDELMDQRALDFKDCPSLCGGMLSGYGTDGSFRGKVYAADIERITGVDIYQQVIPNETVKEMATLLEAAQQMGDRARDLKALAIWFRTAADKGYDLAGWW